MKLDKLDLNGYLNPNPNHLKSGQRLKYPFDDMCAEFGENENEIVDDFSDYISEIENTDKDETRNYFRQKLHKEEFGDNETYDDYLEQEEQEMTKKS